jgi:hypothetical protein
MSRWKSLLSSNTSTTKHKLKISSTWICLNSLNTKGITILDRMSSTDKTNLVITRLINHLNSCHLKINLFTLLNKIWWINKTFKIIRTSCFFNKSKMRSNSSCTFNPTQLRFKSNWFFSNRCSNNSRCSSNNRWTYKLSSLNKK